MQRKFLPLTEDTRNPRSEEVPTLTRLSTGVGVVECPQCGQLGDHHSRDCPHNLTPRDSTLDRRLMPRRQRADRRMALRYGPTARHRRHASGRRKEDEWDPVKAERSTYL